MSESNYGQKWTEDEVTLAYFLYCQIPFSSIRYTNPEIISLAKLLGRTPGSVSLKLTNLAHFDPELQKRFVNGMSHASKMDFLVFSKYSNHWEELVAAAHAITTSISSKSSNTDNHSKYLDFPPGLSVTREINTRLNQNFFREAVLSSYQNRCCITGLSVPSLLVASHIKPWVDSNPQTERTNPCNGLCLNCLHDKAFDRGLITVLPNHKIIISSKLMSDSSDGARWLQSYKNKEIELPERFLPSSELLQYHNDVIFIP